MIEKKTVLILAVVIVIVAAVAIVYAFASGDQDPDDSGNESITSDHEVQTLTETDSRLWIVGNANLDDVIDEKDIEYIQAIIDGEAVEYYLDITFSSTSDLEHDPVSMADANGDGVVDELDIEKVRSMIAGEEQIIYYVDVDGFRNSVHFPVTSIISLYYLSSLQIQMLERTDLVVACDINSSTTVFLADNYGDKAVYDNTARYDPDPESVMAINPDMVLTGSRGWYCNELEAGLPADRDGIDIVRLATWEEGNVQVGILTLAYMLDNMEKGLEYIEWTDSILSLIEERTSTLSDDEKVTVIIPSGREAAMYEVNCIGSGKYETSLLAGVINIADRLGTDQSYIDFEEEWLFQQSDLDYIIYAGFDYLEDPTYNPAWTEAMIERFGTMTEAYGTQIHTISNSVLLGPAYVVGVIYLANLVYPDLFPDLDPDSLFQEFVDKFMGWDFDVAAYSAQNGIVA